jgi:glycerol transport system ATP-binding protein
MAEIVLEGISHSYQVAARDAEPSARAGAPGKEASYALRDIELRWRDGGAYALLGPSGCGKSTLLGIISGLIQPTRGRVLYDGKDVTARSSRERNIAQVFQFPVVYDTMTVEENLAFPLRNRGLDSAKIRSRVREVAEILELTPTLARRATRLTADEKQILALGRGLVREDVAAILFDEPLTVIDPHRKWMLRRKLKAIHRQFKHTLIYVTHDQTEALTFADEVVVMSTGTVLQRGTPEELFRRPAHTYVGYFIGSPGMNVLPCALVAEGGADGGAAVEVCGHRVALPAALAKAARAASGTLELGIRPEHVLIAEPGAGEGWGEGGAGAGGAGRLPLLVTAVENHGRFRIVAGKLGEQPLKVRLLDDPDEGGQDKGASDASAAAAAAPPLSALAAGVTLHVRFDPAYICLYRDSRIVAAEEAAA